MLRKDGEEKEAAVKKKRRKRGLAKNREDLRKEREE